VLLLVTDLAVLLVTDLALFLAFLLVVFLSTIAGARDRRELGYGDRQRE
jgi:hypothetical protein